MILSPGQPIPHGRPYRYHLNGPVHMMTARKRVGPLPTHRLAVRHLLIISSDFVIKMHHQISFGNASSNSSSRHSLSDHSLPYLPGTSAGPSRKRRRSPMTSVSALSHVSGALSSVHADLIPSPKRVKDSGYLADVELILEELFEAFDRDETETGVRGPVEVKVERVTHPVMPEDIPEPAQEGAVEVTYRLERFARGRDHRIVEVESAVTALTEELLYGEDNRRLRGTVSVESQRVDQL
ncbi:hypothetical protein Tco_0725135 [Tanacetum coccineum]|uniref:Uncharacterized protein n=1 Tax=Tanacetum coccineum TaxID=301880 RepID=A0ABQ4YC15_9ASTR